MSHAYVEKQRLDRGGPAGGDVDTSICIHIPGNRAAEGMAALWHLYRKGANAQWDETTAIDWNHRLDEHNPLSMPDRTLPLFGSEIWNRMSEEQRSLLRRQIQGWQISQILYGERASQLCAGKIMLASNDPAEKACAAMQAADEVRHIEVYAKLLEKIGAAFPAAPSLDRLLYDVLWDPDPGMTAIGMQILVEGLALAFFRILQLCTGDPMVKALLTLVLRDEARHFAGGQIALAEQCKQLTGAQLKRREEFVVQAVMLLNDYLLAEDLWDQIGLPRRECAEIVRSSGVTQSIRLTLFRQLVPAVRSIGLLGKNAERAFTEIGVLGYARFPGSLSGVLEP
jgi:P-aminobenzoate N-oxygenase AurF